MSKPPKTLAEAHDMLMKIMPKLDAPPRTWLEFRLRAAQVYTAVADVDRFHHHEAMYWAAFEHRKGDTLRRDLAGE